MLLFLASLFTAQAEGNIHFPELLTQVDEASFGSEQLIILSSIPETEELSSRQVKKLIDELAFSKDKLKALRTLAPHISDTHNAYLIFESFDYASDKREAKTIIEKLHKEQKRDSYQDKLTQLEQTQLYLEQKEQELIKREQELDHRETRLRKWKERLQIRKRDLERREQIVEQKEQKIKEREEARKSRHSRYYGDDDEGYYGRHRGH